mmetsp:Transcript_10946/g.25468  ORF Transcript_10946/g.25468 Transcript_10946/m.25468 type:complete len:203 (-) Transcript_10946:684-1292(-)
MHHVLSAPLARFVKSSLCVAIGAYGSESPATTIEGTCTRDGWHSFSWWRSLHRTLMGSDISAACANILADKGGKMEPASFADETPEDIVKSSMAPSALFRAASSARGKSSWSVWPQFASWTSVLSGGGIAYLTFGLYMLPYITSLKSDSEWRWARICAMSAPWDHPRRDGLRLHSPPDAAPCLSSIQLMTASASDTHWSGRT